MYGSDFDGRSVIVTGAGSGVGRAAALQFAGEGARVLLADRSKEAVGQVLRTIEYAGGTARAVVGDLSEQHVVDEVVATAVGFFGGVDVLAHTAGITDRLSALADTDDAEWRRVLEVDLTAPFLLTRAVLPHMLAEERGAIVLTLSEAGLRGGVAGAARTVAEHGVCGLVRSLAAMYRGHGIRANAVAAGATAAGVPVDAESGAHGPGLLGPCLRASGEVANPHEQAAALVFLASDDAGHINGVVLPVDSGRSVI